MKNRLNLFIKIFLFLTAYYPLFLILFVQNSKLIDKIFSSEHITVKWTTLNDSLVYGLALGLIFYILLKLFIKFQSKSNTSQYRVIKIKDISHETLNYILTYLIAFLSLQLNNPKDIISILILLFIIGIIYVNSNLLYINPLQNYLNTVEEAQKSLADLMKEPPSNLYKELTKGSKDNTEPKSEMFTFEGILGQNCGEVEKYINSSKQLQAKDFVVSRGIRVLRGYAKASDIYKASKTEYDYQRPINEPHIDSIKDFLLKMKDSAKYLPEVTLVARNDYELEKFTLNSKSLSDTQKGIIDNLNYYKLKVQQNSLYRIDGNHRIEAANVLLNLSLLSKV